LKADRIFPSYKPLVRTGRVSCSKPNVQQLPRGGGLRGAFVPSSGHLLLAVDYSTAELRTLAVHCRHRFGTSSLGDVFAAEVDPHAHTAAMLRGVPVEKFLAWKDDPLRKDQYESDRQSAKPVNFGVPGGLGAESLERYARRVYKVEMTTDQATQHREKLIYEIYPELALYLAEDAHAILADNLQADVEEVRRRLGNIHLSSVRKILEGDPKTRHGRAYSEQFVWNTWTALSKVNRNANLQEALRSKVPDNKLARRVCQTGVATLTRRIRGRVTYSQARNTPFQGLAADGAALALFKLVKEGFRVVGFIHDEVLIELPDEGGYVSEDKVRRVEEIMTEAMSQVLGDAVPAAVESALTRRWYKGAKLVVQDGKVYPWEPKKKEKDKR
jgi:DNA polymerase I-like protein with 3'-5' exonuclease and polymerase domains